MSDCLNVATHTLFIPSYRGVLLLGSSGQMECAIGRRRDASSRVWCSEEGQNRRRSWRRLLIGWCQDKQQQGLGEDVYQRHEIDGQFLWGKEEVKVSSYKQSK